LVVQVLIRELAATNVGSFKRGLGPCSVEWGAKAAGPALLNVLNDRDAEVRAAAQTALKMIGHVPAAEKDLK